MRQAMSSRRTSTRASSKSALSFVATNRQFSEGIRTPTRSPHEDPCQSAGYRHARSDCHCGHKAAGPIYCESRQSRRDHTCQVREAILQAGPSAGCFWTSECLGECENAPLKAIMKTYLLLALLRSVRPRTRKTKYLQEGLIAFGLTHFFFERCYVFAQRVDNALVSLFSLARALQLPRIKRLSERDPEFPETRQDSADW